MLSAPVSRGGGGVRGGDRQDVRLVTLSEVRLEHELLAGSYYLLKRRNKSILSQENGNSHWEYIPLEDTFSKLTFL